MYKKYCFIFSDSMDDAIELKKKKKKTPTKPGRSAKDLTDTVKEDRADKTTKKSTTTVHGKYQENPVTFIVAGCSRPKLIKPDHFSPVC